MDSQSSDETAAENHDEAIPGTSSVHSKSSETPGSSSTPSVLIATQEHHDPSFQPAVSTPSAKVINTALSQSRSLSSFSSTPIGTEAPTISRVSVMPKPDESRKKVAIQNDQTNHEEHIGVKLSRNPRTSIPTGVKSYGTDGSNKKHKKVLAHSHQEKIKQESLGAISSRYDSKVSSLTQGKGSQHKPNPNAITFLKSSMISTSSASQISAIEPSENGADNPSKHLLTSVATKGRSLPHTGSERKSKRPAKYQIRLSPVLHDNNDDATFFKCFQFAVGLVSFTWAAYFLLLYLCKIEVLSSALLPTLPLLSWHQWSVLGAVFSVFAIALITAISVQVYRIISPMLHYPNYIYDVYPVHYRRTDPTHSLLSHLDRMKESVSKSMDTKKPTGTLNAVLNEMTDLSSQLHLYPESGHDLLDAFFLQRLEKFKNIAKKYESILRDIRAQQQELGVRGNPKLPKYMICSPCYNQYTCHHVHFNHRGYRYHCQPYKPEILQPRKKMSFVKYYKDKIFVDNGLRERQALDWSAPNDFRGRNLHSFVARRYPPVLDGESAFRPPKKDKMKQQQRTVKSIYTRRYCSERDPCPSCAIEPLPVEHAAVEKPAKISDCCGNRILKNNMVTFQVNNNKSLNINFPRKLEARRQPHQAAPLGLSGETTNCGPDIIFMNHNFDYEY